MRRVKVGVGTALLVLVAAAVALPLYWLIVASTKGNAALFNTPTFLPASASSFTHNVSKLITTSAGIFPRWFLNSLIYAGSVATIGTYLATLGGYSLAKYRFKARGLILVMVLGTLMVPSTVLIIPTFILEHALHLTDTYIGVILPLLLFPFGVYFMSIYAAEAVPSALLEAGRIDGAHEFQLFHRIALPVLVPGMVTLFLISFIGTWNNYFLPLVLIGTTQLFPLTVGLSIWLGTVSSPGANQVLYPQIVMGSLVSVLPMLVAFPFMQKYIVRGLSLGALTAE